MDLKHFMKCEKKKKNPREYLRKPLEMADAGNTWSRGGKMPSPVLPWRGWPSSGCWFFPAAPALYLSLAAYPRRSQILH